MAEYILPATEAIERRRLALLERHHDPDTIAALEAIGVGPGWRCLDVGAGQGSISRWLLARGAKVLATDLDIGGLDGVDARVHDITSDEPLPGPFDLVHTRLVLLHLPQRRAVLDRLAELAPPGGHVVVGDIEFTPVAMTNATPEWHRTWAAWCAATQAAGWDLACGRRLVDMFGAAGLVGLRASSSEHPGRGGGDALVILSLALEKLRPRLVEHGASDADVTAARAALEDPAHEFVGPTTWTVCGQRPAGMEL